jgi:hypothetical protein
MFVLIGKIKYNNNEKMKLELYYSNYCTGSKRISHLFKEFPQLREIVELRCIDSYYKQYKRFPDGIRGTPTIFNEENNKIKAYEGQSAFELLKQIINESKNPVQKNLPQSGIPVGGVCITPSQPTSTMPEIPDNKKIVEGAGTSSGVGVSISAMTATTADWFDASKLPLDEKAAQSTVNPFAISVKDMYKDKMDETQTKLTIAQMEESRNAENNRFKSKLSASKNGVVPRPNLFAEPMKKH